MLCVKLGLFQRAILMSGTALSPMALSRDPREITLQVIKQLNCSSDSDDAIAKCLKNAKLEDLLNARVSFFVNDEIFRIWIINRRI